MVLRSMDELDREGLGHWRGVSGEGWMREGGGGRLNTIVCDHE
jgi:hypothetical protein